MIEVTIPETHMFDDETQEFIDIKQQTIKLEHSLVSLSKWEAKHCKPFLKDDKKTSEEIIDYIRCMTITGGVSAEAYYALSSDSLNKIKDYIYSKQTATKINRKNQRRGGNKTITSEQIYYWMITLGIPFECQKWHLNRLLTLIEVCAVESQPKKKMKTSDIYAQNAALNAARCKRLGTRG